MGERPLKHAPAPRKHGETVLRGWPFSRQLTIISTMSHRYVPLASLLGGLLFAGCVIYTEPQDGPPPPPPPPPAAQPAPPAQPGKVGSIGPPNAPPPASKGGAGAINHGRFTSRLIAGEILVVVNGGNCDISIDGTSHGVAAQHKMKVGAGEHTVGCKPDGKPAQSQKVSVAKDELVTVAFDLNNPANTTSVSKPANVAPPVGRPTPTQ